MFVCAVNSSAFLCGFRALCVIVVRKVARVTPTFVGCACCADRLEHLPWRRCFGTRVSLEIPVLHSGGKRQERAGVAVFAHVEIVGLFLFLMHTWRNVEPENLSASHQQVMYE